MRITAYADRLIADLDRLDWPESIKLMQRNWIGRSEGAEVALRHGRRRRSRCSPPGPTRCSAPRTWCSRPSTRSSTRSSPPAWPDGIDPRWTGGAATPGRGRRRVPARRRPARARSTVRAEGRDKTGVFLGAYATNPVNGELDPGVRRRLRAHGLRHRRHHGRARPGPARLGLRRRRSACRSSARCSHPTGGRARPSPARAPPSTPSFLDGMGIAEAKAAITDWLEERGARHGAPSPTSCATGSSPGSATGASRSRSSSTSTTCPSAVPEDELPVLLPEIDDYSPRTFDDDDNTSDPEPPLGRADGVGRGHARPRRRPEGLPPRAQHDAAVGRARAGTSCATSTPPTRTPSSTRRSSGTGWARSSRATRGGVDLYVGGVEHAVLHLLYARFWHKVLFDLGHLSSSEPFRRLVQPGLHPGAPPSPTTAASTSRPARWSSGTAASSTTTSPVNREFGKIGKSLKNMITPDDLYRGVRRRHAPPLRDVHRPARPEPAVGDQGRRRRLPPAPAHLAQRPRRGHRRRCESPTCPPTTRPAGSCTGRSPPCATAWRRCGSTPRSPGSPS